MVTSRRRMMVASDAGVAFVLFVSLPRHNTRPCTLTVCMHRQARKVMRERSGVPTESATGHSCSCNIGPYTAQAAEFCAGCALQPTLAFSHLGLTDGCRRCFELLGSTGVMYSVQGHRCPLCTSQNHLDL